MRRLALTLLFCAYCSCLAQGQSGDSAEIRQTTYEYSPTVSYVSGGSVTVIYYLTINFNHCGDDCVSSLRWLASQPLFAGTPGLIQTSSDSASLSLKAYGYSYGSQLSGPVINASPDTQGTAPQPLFNVASGIFTASPDGSSQPFATYFNELGSPADSSFVSVSKGVQELTPQPLLNGASNIITPGPNNALSLGADDRGLNAPFSSPVLSTSISDSGSNWQPWTTGTPGVAMGSESASLSLTGVNYYGVHLADSVIGASRDGTTIWPQSLNGTSSIITPVTNNGPVSLVADDHGLSAPFTSPVLGTSISDSGPSWRPWAKGASGMVPASSENASLSLTENGDGVYGVHFSESVLRDSNDGTGVVWPQGLIGASGIIAPPSTYPLSASDHVTRTYSTGSDWPFGVTGSNIIVGTDYSSLSKTISDLTANGRTITGWTISYRTAESH